MMVTTTTINPKTLPPADIRCEECDRRAPLTHYRPYGMHPRWLCPMCVAEWEEERKDDE